MKSITSWFSIPYYFNPSLKFKFRVSLIISVFVFLFLFFFKPFYLVTLGDLVLKYTAGIGFVTFFGVFFMLYVPPLIFKDYFNEGNWTIGKNFIFITVGILINGIILWLISSYYNKDFNLENLSLLQFLIYTYLVATIPIIFFVVVNEKYIREKREKLAEEINKHNKEKLLKREVKINEEVTVYSDNKKEQLSFKISDLVYITSQGNYVSFFIRNENTILKEKILRVTLTKIENELKGFSNIIRCHKSYIINSKYIKDVSGNARGYLLKSDYIPFEIPVSRSFSKQSLMSLVN
ncbi:LytTR family transcriptional regulator [Polaribacter sp. MSW13]|uniref:LytTR family transcriptional regulator n=1 Tax=Polaribacter marinus TaxID=2916838 RepID=A0A9X1VR63_9FLAO|nr:LytTR family DNA-binding domain-containing protein [Polaribacter marinus]MCI2229447.1 LytTR family transcriptional regulator [Polaribacter marinus]